ncbi:MAG: hypothetical protein A3D31_14640 [Candidatus Fluviicola riflensis]|nr:MAG: hypothetical protein CHH17_19075 [Candidatus Fluviicola riflensis]OGS78204.1 MAG: hypothetical protein A3D31_14640 [Candidatus Fluviicola riflensis]OGS85270.1 MAG: hypothetical protein A2724_11575 [Fluviicola sp. RIFCSPHIGHO2_01_FULL_43_53]OGS87312.1 MAG: hypothetical protein A3E30_07995 [Fluviicola sp. RIFCSPHIGHO2_12_FULL_43_24]
MSGDRRMASIYFEDTEANSNPIISLVILHTSIVSKGVYANPDTSSKEPFSLYKWTKKESYQFKQNGNQWWANNVVMINKHMHDVWAVALQRKNNNYVEYLTKTEGFWEKLGEDVVKGVCDAAIDVFDVADDEVTTLVLQKATDKLIDHLFNSKDGDVLMENWVHFDPRDQHPRIDFKFEKKKGHIHSTDHSTDCKVDKFGNR